jgi:hypothetical protein
MIFMRKLLSGGSTVRAARLGAGCRQKSFLHALLVGIIAEDMTPQQGFPRQESSSVPALRGTAVEAELLGLETILLHVRTKSTTV